MIMHGCVVFDKELIIYRAWGNECRTLMSLSVMALWNFILW